VEPILPNVNATTATTKEVSRRAYLGFTVFDLVHIACAITLIVFASNERPIDALEFAESLVEIIFSLLLMTFIAVLAKHNHNRQQFNTLYTFAWLVATASLLSSSVFFVPEILMGTWSATEVLSLTLELVALTLGLVTFALTMVALLLSRNAAKWKRAMIAPLIAVMVFASAQCACNFALIKEVPILLVECVKDLVPFVPAIMGLIMVFEKPKEA